MSIYKQITDMWQSWSVASVSDIDLRLHNFRIIFAYHSGRIENLNITYNDTLCYEFLKPKIAAREPLTVGLVLETHAVLTGGTYDERRFVELGERPGAFKKHDYVTGREEVGSAPEDVPCDVADLLDEVRDYGGGDTLKAAAYFHLRFEYIHPFADGNGRVGRTLLNYFLMISDHPPLIVYDEDKALYYAALDAYDMHEDIQPMYDFLRKQTELTWAKTPEREWRRTEFHRDHPMKGH